MRQTSSTESAIENAETKSVFKLLLLLLSYKSTYEVHTAE